MELTVAPSWAVPARASSMGLSIKLQSLYISCLPRPFSPAVLARSPIRANSLAFYLCGCTLTKWAVRSLSINTVQKGVIVFVFCWSIYMVVVNLIRCPCSSNFVSNLLKVYFLNKKFWKCNKKQLSLRRLKKQLNSVYKVINRKFIHIGNFQIRLHLVCGTLFYSLSKQAYNFCSFTHTPII